MTPGYDEIYLDSSMNILGQAFDWVANTCEDSLDRFVDRFVSAPVAALFASGCPKYVAGVNGAELVNETMKSLDLPEYPQEHEFWLDKSPEYWIGWMLAYLQWREKVSFRHLLEHVPLDKIRQTYHLGHEQDVEHIAGLLLKESET